MRTPTNDSANVTEAVCLRSLPRLMTLLILCLSVIAWATEKRWETEWEEIVAAAKKEGTVVVDGTPDATTRRAIPARFHARFGITVEYLASRGSQVVQKLRAEHQAGFSSIDVVFSGMNMALLYKDKILDPIKPLLLLPGVLDGSKWKKGEPWFVDPQGEYMLRLFNFVSDMFHINTRYVKPEELTSVKDLLNPKWMGKITADDPTVSGPGANTAVIFYLLQGEEFVKRLYIDQKPVISRNRRQHADWLARGTHPISLDAPSGEVKRLREEGFPITSVYSLPDAPGRLSAGGGIVTLVNKAPHPNAARVFLNWIASKEGLEVYSRARLIPTTRNDVDESFLEPEAIPRPGVNYLDAYEWNFATVEQEKIKNRVKELLRK